jgi:Ni/Co efflux regulator RcnB
MKRLLCAVAAIALLMPAAASAQQTDRQGKRTEQQRQARPNHRPSRSGPNHGRPTTKPAPNRPGRPNHGHPTIQPIPNRPHRPGNGRPTIQPVPNRPSRPVYRPGHRPSSYHRIRATAFRYPRGYSYRRWAVGAILPHLFLSNYYYWNNYGALGLGAPPPGYVWVRYGPDLLLVNRYNGRIADVIYGAFY